MDVDARIQLFDLKVTYQFQTTPGRTNYNMPLYNVQTEPGSQSIASFPVYQGFLEPCYVNGVQIPFYTQKNSFNNVFSTYVQPLNQVVLGDGINSNYTINFSGTGLVSNPPTNPPIFPVLQGHIDITGIISTGSNEDPPYISSGPSTNFLNTIPKTSVIPAVYITTTAANGKNIIVSDSGQFLENGTDQDTYGLLMVPGVDPTNTTNPLGNTALSGGYSTTLNTINYSTGVANVTFTDFAGSPIVIEDQVPINVQYYTYTQGMPRGILFYNNTLTILPPPNIQYMVSLEAYLSPAAFLSTTQAIPFGYMAEYIARGAARKILSDTGDVEQFNFYEPFFLEQERLVWKRSQRIFTATRTQTLFSEGNGFGLGNQLGPGSST